MPFQILNDIELFLQTIKSLLDTFSVGIKFIIQGFKTVTIGVCHGNILTSPISVGKIISFISHSNIVFAGLEIFNCIVFLLNI